MNFHGKVEHQWRWINLPHADAAVHAQTAVEMRSGCQAVVAAKVYPDGRVSFNTTFESGACWGGFGAVQQAIRYADQNGRRYFDVCAPPESTHLQIVRVFTAFADRHPEKLHLEWFDIAIDALHEAFPC